MRIRTAVKTAYVTAGATAFGSAFGAIALEKQTTLKELCVGTLAVSAYALSGLRRELEHEFDESQGVGHILVESAKAMRNETHLKRS